MSHRFGESVLLPRLNRYEEGLRNIVREVKAQGVQVVLTPFISVAREGLEVSYEESPRLFQDIYRKFYLLSPGEMAHIYDPVNDRSRKVALEENVPYADVAAEFPRDPKYFLFDYVHLTPEGNQLLAAELAQFLEANVLPTIIQNDSE
jgi:lysophospholipase L1-like esterase